MVIVKTSAVGGSLIVTIPKELVDIEVKKVKVSGFGILRNIAPFKKEDEFDIE